jgi:phosphonate transport system substrate-binding protein
MARPISFIIGIFAALAFGGIAAAQDCPRGDLVADTPTDPKQYVNPPTLVFAYTPVEDPALYTKVWDGFLRHVEKVTGKKVVFFPVQSNAAI